MIPWIAAVAGIGTAGVIWLRARPRRTSDRVLHIKDYIYLDRGRVMAMYWQGEYRGKERTVVVKTTSSKITDMSATFHGVGGKGSRSSNEETSSKWIERDEAVS